MQLQLTSKIYFGILVTIFSFAITALLAYLFLVVWYVPPFSPWRTTYLTIGTFGFLGVELLFLIGFYNTLNKTKAGIFFINANLMFFSIITCLAFLEMFFQFIPRSHNSSHPLSEQLWYRKYWGKLNSFGFRDPEYTHQQLQSKKRIFILGDSFAAGAGISNRDLRFGDLLQHTLPENNLVINLGVPGADTIQEYSVLTKFPYKPDVVVLSYYLNDILGTPSASKYWTFNTNNKSRFNVFSESLADRSFLFGFLFYSLPVINPILNSSYFEQLRKAYNDPEVFSDHSKELTRLFSFTRNTKAPVIVVFFPILQDITGSLTIQNQFEDLFQQEKVTLIKVADLVSDLSPLERIVNSQDAHPSEVVHSRVAKKLAEVIRTETLSDGATP